MIKSNKNAYQIASNLYLCLLLLYPLWFDSAGLTAISSAKRYAFYTINAIYILSFFTILLIEVLRGKRTLSDFAHFSKRISLTQIFVLLYLLFTLISALLSPYRNSVLLGASRSEGLLTIACYCIGFFLIAQFSCPKKWMLWLFSAVMIIFCIVGILQRLNFNPFSLYPAIETPHDYSLSFFSTIGNVDYVASFLCIAIPFLWVTVLRADEKKRFLLLIPLIFALSALVLIDVAAGFVGIFAGALFSVPVVIPASKKSRRILFFCIIAFVVLLLIIVRVVDFSNRTLHEFHEMLNGHLGNKFGSSRILIWKRVAVRIPERLWFGHGPDTMSLTGIPNINILNSKKVVVLSRRIDVAHNEYLNILFHQGLFALICYLAALVSALLKWIRKSPANPVIAAFGAAVFVYCIQAFFGISQLITAPFFWCALALLENACRHKNRPPCI